MSSRAVDFREYARRRDELAEDIEDGDNLNAIDWIFLKEDTQLLIAELDGIKSAFAAVATSSRESKRRRRARSNTENLIYSCRVKLAKAL